MYFKTLVFLTFIFGSLYAQDNFVIAGKWFTELKLNKSELALEIEISTDLSKGFISVPANGLKSIALKNFIARNDSIFFIIPIDGSEYRGKYENQKIIGNLSLNGKSVQLNYSRTPSKTAAITDTLTNSKVVNQEIKISVKDENFYGTLTFPKSGSGSYPLAIFLSVSGINDRDQTHSNGHKPFSVLANSLAEFGIASFRFDDRGFNSSPDKYYKATFETLTSDVLAIKEKLKTHHLIDSTKIGFIGNSEGATIAVHAAAIDPSSAFAIMLGGAGQTPRQVIKNQTTLLLNRSKNKQFLKSNSFIEKQIDSLHNYLVYFNAKRDSSRLISFLSNARLEGFLLPKDIHDQYKIFTSDWYRYQLSYNPEKYLQAVSCPLLALSGTNDLFVPPHLNFPLIANALAKSKTKNYSLVVLDGVNHLMQTSKTGLPEEYSTIKEAFSKKALAVINNWLTLTILH